MDLNSSRIDALPDSVLSKAQQPVAGSAVLNEVDVLSSSITYIRNGKRVKLDFDPFVKESGKILRDQRHKRNHFQVGYHQVSAEVLRKVAGSQQFRAHLVPNPKFANTDL